MSDDREYIIAPTRVVINNDAAPGPPNGPFWASQPLEALCSIANAFVSLRVIQDLGGDGQEDMGLELRLGIESLGGMSTSGVLCAVQESQSPLATPRTVPYEGPGVYRLGGSLNGFLARAVRIELWTRYPSQATHVLLVEGRAILVVGCENGEHATRWGWPLSRLAAGAA